ncbi:MATE efflux family protein [Porphyromonas uenonis 60-3]|uniref:Multidrug-efflux transporter n=1 Tax=Porphyromonas uenonis 60-3 TaxID=596327 RepID=C2M9J8_9PORP|nr:MATE family efflux transporter [Porphyromonas uenonis]EEK17567.1 MATE efflux family protein [Porphyromonas uenonis 60-3]
MSWSTYYRSCQEHFRPLLRLGLPVIIGQVGLILVGFADNVMVSHHSLSELAAASFVNNFLNLVIIFGMGFSYGLTPLVATNKEWGRSDQVAHYLGHSFLLNLLIALLIGGGLFLLEGSLGAFNLSEELRPIALPYYRIQILGFMVVMLFNTFKQYTEGMGDTQIPMYITLAGNVLNIGLNYLLIYGKGGFPEWGLYGAGLSTLVSRVVMLIAIVAVTVLLPRYRKILDRVKSLHWSWREGLVPLLRLGTPVALQMGMEAASFSVAVILVARISTAALAAHQIIATISTLGFMVYYGIGAATAIRSSTLLAQGERRETRYVASAGVYLCLFVAAVMMPLLVLCREPVVRLFNADLSVAEATYLALIPLCLYQIGDALQIVYANTLRGISRVAMLAPAAALCHLIVAPTMAWLFGFGVGLEGNGPQLMGVWFAFPVSLTLLGLILRYSFRRATR